MKYLYLLAFFFSTSNLESGCKKTNNLIIWDQHYQLTDDDFKSKEPAYLNTLAESFIGLRVEYEYRDTLVFDVLCTMDKSKSWMIENSIYVLKHEKGHFDIGEIYARILRKSIFSVKKSIKPANFKIIDSLYYDIGKKMLDEQRKYDTATTIPARNREAQSAWNLSIQKRLDSLDGYKRNKSEKLRLKR